MLPPPQVTVKEATNLKNMETFGRMNPYTVIWVNFEPHEKSTEVATLTLI